MHTLRRSPCTALERGEPISWQPWQPTMSGSDHAARPISHLVSQTNTAPAALSRMLAAVLIAVQGANECAYSLNLPQKYRALKPIPYEEYQCAQHNETCIWALRTIANFAGGMLGLHDGDNSAGPTVYGLGPLPDSCGAGVRERYYPCVTAPLAALAYRDACSLDVTAGCSDASSSTSVGCEMRAGARVAFDAVEGTLGERLAGEWVVGPDGQSGSRFFVYRADGQPHAFDVSDPALVAGGRAQLGSVRCRLSPIPTTSDNVSTIFSYDQSCASDGAAWDGAVGGAAAAVAGLATVGVVILFRRRYVAAKRGTSTATALLQRPDQRDAASQANGSLDAPPAASNQRAAGSGRQVSFDLTAERQLVRPSRPGAMPVVAGALPAWDIMFVDGDDAGTKHTL